MNVLVLSGSPLENRNISNMAKVAVDAAKKAGNNVKTINIYNQEIGHCIGCMKCRKTGICILKDDYDYIRKLIVKFLYILQMFQHLLKIYLTDFRGQLWILENMVFLKEDF